MSAQTQGKKSRALLHGSHIIEGNQFTDVKDLCLTEPEELHSAIRFLQSTKQLSFAEVKKVARQSPGIDHARGIVPVRLTVPAYPQEPCTHSLFESVQDFILEAVHREGAPFLLELILMAGYVLVLAQTDASAEFVRSLVPELMRTGVCLKEPTRPEIKQYYARIFERNEQKNSLGN